MGLKPIGKINELLTKSFKSNLRVLIVNKLNSSETNVLLWAASGLFVIDASSQITVYIVGLHSNISRRLERE